MTTARAKPHHVKAEFCTTRAKYREGRELKAVKVYTVNQESRYLLVQGIPDVGTHDDLLKMFALYGPIQEYRLLDDYPKDDFTEVMLIKFQKIPAARIAKRKMDNQGFYGGMLHVCYAPELETVQDTREKLQDRRKSIAARIRRLAEEGQSSGVSSTSSTDTSSKEWAYRTPTQSMTNSIPPLHNDSLAREPQPRLPQPQHLQQQHFQRQQPEQQPQIQQPQVQTQESPMPHPPFMPPGHQHLPIPVNKQPHEPTSSQTKGTSKEASNSYGVVIKEFQNRTLPKFIPRQVQRTSQKTNIKKHLLVKPNTKETHVNDSLRMEALVLRGVQGPQLLEDEEERRVAFKSSDTGSESVDETVAAIRKRVQEFSTIAPPPQLKRKKKT